MKEEIPIFPLPGLLYYPGRILPLHIFEERYRELMRDALAGDRRFALAVLRPGWEPDYDQRPAVFPLVCIGTITKYRQVPDGRFVLHLKGESRARLLDERDGKPYRIGLVERIEETPLSNGNQESIVTRLERRLIELCGRPILPPYDSALPAPPEITAIEIADEATMSLPLPIERKIEIASIPDHAARIETLLDSVDRLIEMRRMLDKSKAEPPDNLQFN